MTASGSGLNFKIQSLTSCKDKTGSKVALIEEIQFDIHSSYIIYTLHMCIWNVFGCHFFYT